MSNECYNNNQNNILTEFEQYELKKKVYLKKAIISFIILMLFPIIVIIITKSINIPRDEKSLNMTDIIGILSPIIIFFVVIISIIALIKNLSKYFKYVHNVALIYENKIFPELIQNNFTNVIYDRNIGFTKEEIIDFDICQIKEYVCSSNKLQATYNDIDFTMAMVSSWYETTDKDNNGNEQKKKQYVFDNLVLTFPYTNKDNVDIDIKILLDTLKYVPVTKTELKIDKVELESVDFNNKYDVYSKNPHNVFYILTPQYMERLINLPIITIKFYQNRAIVAFKKNILFKTDVVFNNDMLTTINDLQNDINIIKYVIDAIKNFTQYNQEEQIKQIKLKLNIKPKGEI